MGKLALWGAVGGAGKGMVENAEAQRKIDMAQIEEMREVRIRQLENEMATVRQRQSQEFQAGEGEKDRGFKKEETAAERHFRESQAGEEREFKASEGSKDRASAERIAGMRAEAAGGSKKGRWDFSKVKETSMLEGGMPGEFEIPMVRDKKTGRQYLQRGDRFMLPGDEPKSVRRAARSEVDKLMQNPGQADNFLNTYRYLPIEFFSMQQQQNNEEFSSDNESEESDY